MNMNGWMKAELLHNERWEDEGGTTAGIEVPRGAGRFVRPVLKTEGLQDIPRQWSRKFTIEPFQTETSFAASKRDATSTG